MLLKELSVAVLKACDTFCLSLQLCNGMYVTFQHSGNVI